MSVKLICKFINTLRNKVPRIPKNSAFQIRLTTTMDTMTDEKEVEVLTSKHATRYKNRFRKRQWEDGSTQLNNDNEESDPKRPSEQPTERVKRKKVAMLLGYCGVDYFGMQRNPGVRTIEEDLLKALWEAKYITDDDFKNQQNAQFQRSSRTDKGVSAARQVVSLKMPLDYKIEDINSRLPECIRVFGIRRVTKGFNSKLKCNARTYSYTLPTYTFDPNVTSNEDKKAYRISKERLEQVNNMLSVYKGTKSYHNFTERKGNNDPSCLRYMMHFTVDKVFVERDMEFAALLVKGQSFMMHQIRKMVGLVIAVMRGQTTMEIFNKAVSKEKVMLPTAPGLGLVLDTVHYDQYDNKFKASHDTLTWEPEEKDVQIFTHSFIYPTIVKGEVEGDSMSLWLEKLATHSYEPSDENGEWNSESNTGSKESKINKNTEKNSNDNSNIENNSDVTGSNDNIRLTTEHKGSEGKMSNGNVDKSDSLCEMEQNIKMDKEGAEKIAV